MTIEEKVAGEFYKSHETIIDYVMADEKEPFVKVVVGWLIG